MSESAVILLAHGSRDPQWQAPFDRLASELSASLGPGAVRAAYLQFCSPDLAETLAAAVADGAGRVAILPLFLSAGGHVSRDIPAQVESIRKQFPAVDIKLLAAIGEDQRFLELVGEIVTEPMRREPSAPSQQVRPADRDDLRKLLGELFDSQSLAVLATQRDGQPYCSLVAFAASGDLKNLLFATARATHKFENLTADPRVALMVDSRTPRDSTFHDAVAVTAIGRARPVPNSSDDPHRRRYLAKHPALSDFAESPDQALVCVEVEKYVVVRKFQEVTEFRPT